MIKSIKIAVPWPFKESSRSRIKDALSLWEDKSNLLLCLIKPCNDIFIKDYDSVILPRDSTSIGGKLPKCFIHDMVMLAKDMFPNQDYYGFANSDVVPVGDFIEDYEDYEVLVYHRTDIKKWEHRLRKETCLELPDEVSSNIWKLRQSGMDDRRIARQLNLNRVPLPNGINEWTYAIIRSIFEHQGKVFFWGQDMYLFRRDVVDKVLNQYLKVNDPILGTGGFDPRLTRWCMENYNGARVLHKIFHLEHESEWTVDEAEYIHNGGDIPMDQQTKYYDHKFVESLCKSGQKGAVPKYIKYLLSKENSLKVSTDK